MAKIVREVKRVIGRLHDRLSILPERLAQIRRDRREGDDLRVTQGALPRGARLALFVLWQPDGVAPSTLLTCRHLIACGYAPVVISNAKLADPDRLALLDLCCQLIERPNIGHDFGAWRDAVLLLFRPGAMPCERLVLINDSIWFPLTAEDGLLATLDASAGTHGFTGATWMERPGRAHRAHFQSYLLMFGPRAINHPVFARFWQQYLASSRRDSVLMRGEKGLSGAMVAAGLAAPPALSPQQMLDHANAVPDNELMRILDYAALTDPGRKARRDDLVAAMGDADFRPAAVRFISSTLMAGYFLETHPYLAARSFGMHFLKKRREAVSIEGRRQFLRAVAAGDIPMPHPVVLAEIRARDS